MGLKVLCIAACSRKLSQFFWKMAGKRRKPLWVIVFGVKDVVHHYKSGRQGVVTGWERGNTHMWILFDDGYEEQRDKSAYCKGESWLKKWDQGEWMQMTWDDGRSNEWMYHPHWDDYSSRMAAHD